MCEGGVKVGQGIWAYNSDRRANPQTMNTRNSLAIILSGKGRTVEAEEEFRKVLAVRQRVLGNDYSEKFREVIQGQ